MGFLRSDGTLGRVVNPTSLRRASVFLVLAALLSALLVSVRSGPALAAADSQCIAKPASVSASATKILTLGDSLTRGAAGDYTWRYFLWRHLVTGGSGTTAASPAAYDMVGGYSTLVDPVNGGDSTDFRCAFDTDTGAVGGARLAQYLEKASSTSSSSVARKMVTDSGAGVVVVFAGINDLVGKASSGIAALDAQELLGVAAQVAAEAQAGNSKVKVLFVTAPTYDSSSQTWASEAKKFDSLLLASASSWSTGTSQVAAISAAQHWGGTDLTYDMAHPNPQGEITLGSQIAAGLQGLGVGPSASLPIPSTPLPVGPADPAVLAQPSVSGSTVSLSWTLPAGAVQSRVERKDLTSGTGWTSLGTRTLSYGASGPPYTSTFDDNTYVSGRAYQYRIVAARGSAFTYSESLDNVQYSTTVTSNVVSAGSGPTATATPTSPTTSATAAASTLTKVTGLHAVAGAHRVTLSWTAVPGAAGYFVETQRGESTSMTYLQVNGGSTTTATVSDLVAGQAYGFRVYAATTTAVGEGSDQVTSTPRADRLTAPVLKLAKAGKRFRISWRAVTGAGAYEVQYKAPGAKKWLTVQTSTVRSWKTFRVAKGKTYRVRVRAYDDYVPGPFSTVLRYRRR